MVPDVDAYNHAMKRYLVFSHHEFYPQGGWLDFDSSHDNLEEAKKIAEAKVRNPDYDVAYVVDSQEGKFVASFGYMMLEELNDELAER